MAAGSSSRMNKWKIEIEIQNIPLIFHSLQRLNSVCEEIVVVGGFNFDKLEEMINKNKFVETDNVKVVYNQQYQAGMFSSIKIGATNAKHDNVFIALADMPFVSDETYRLLKTKFETEPQYDYIQPAIMLESVRRKKGHPILVNEKVKAAIQNEKTSTTLRDVLIKFSGNLFLSDDRGISFDIDTEADQLNTEKLFL